MTKYSHEENAAAAGATFKMKMQKVIEKVIGEQFQDICGAKVMYEEESDENMFNLGTMEEPRITYISSLLSPNLKE